MKSDTYYHFTPAPENIVRAFIEQGNGTFWSGNNPVHTTNGPKEIDVEGLICSSEGGVTVAFVVKK